MRLPTVHGVIRRRLLMNFRVDPEVIARQLPAPFRPKLYRETGGITLEMNSAAGNRLDQVVLTTHGSATFDCALVMRNIAHEWHEGASLYL